MEEDEIDNEAEAHDDDDLADARGLDYNGQEETAATGSETTPQRISETQKRSSSVCFAVIGYSHM